MYGGPAQRAHILRTLGRLSLPSADGDAPGMTTRACGTRRGAAGNACEPEELEGEWCACDPEGDVYAPLVRSNGGS